MSPKPSVTQSHQTGPGALTGDKQKEEKISEARETIREKNHSRWQGLFAAQENEKRALEEQLSGLPLCLLLSKEDRARRSDALEKLHETQRQTLRGNIGKQVNKAIGAINDEYKNDLAILKEMQVAQRQAPSERHSMESPESSRAMRAGEDIGTYRDELKEGIAHLPPETEEPVLTAPQRPLAPAPGPSVPVGPAYEARRKRALAAAMEERAEKRLQGVKAQFRPQWAELFKRQREEVKAFEQARQAALPRLFYHLRQQRPVSFESRFAGALKSFVSSKDDLRLLEQRHEDERRLLGRAARRERRAVMSAEEKAQPRELAALEKELAAQAAAFEKAIIEGQGGCVPEQKAAPGTQGRQKDFAARVRARIEHTKRRKEEERKSGRDRDDGGRERE
jgi:hypothetical protein